MYQMWIFHMGSRLDKTGSLLDRRPKDDYHILQILNLLTNAEDSHSIINIHDYKTVQGREEYIGISKTNIAKQIGKEKISREIGNLIDKLEDQKLIVSDTKKKSSKDKFFRITETGKFAFLELQKLFEKKDNQEIEKFLYCCQDIDKNIFCK